jgi:outer membrane lipoprotein-sorting protein
MACWLLSLMLAGPVWAAEVDVDTLLKATDDFARGDSSRAVLEMSVKTARYERTMRLEAWSEGEDKSLIRILSPAKDAGIATLMRDDNIWNYLPKVNRTMKVPGAMMGGRWMGSHFTNDDLVKSSRLSDEFDGEITTRPTAGSGVYTVVLTPKPDAAVVWGKLEIIVGPDLLPRSIGYFDEDGTQMRSMVFSDVKEMDGRRIPVTMTLTPSDKQGEFTRITYVELDFDIAVDERTFSLQALKR